MSHGYRIDVDTDDLLKYTKQHRNGELTEVDVSNRIPGEDWEVTVKDPNGNKSLGTFATKSEARRRASEWMRKHPKGVPGSSSDVSGMGGGIPGMDDGGGLF